MKRFLLGVLVGFFFCGLALVIFAFAMVRFANRPPSIPDSAVLVLRVRGSIPETPPMEIPIFEAGTPTVKDYWELLRKAAADPRIRAVLFLPEDVSAGWGKLEEIRTDLLNFRRTSHKPVYAYLRAPGAREYYMATGADRVVMTPEDYLNLKGLRAELMYVKGTLDKLGVQIEIEHAGKFKDTGDMFTRTGPTPETLEQMNALLDGLYAELVGRIADGRRKSPDEIRTIVDQGPFVAQQALSTGLVDALEYEDQIYGELKRKLGVSEIRKVAARDYLQITPQSVGIEKGRRIALIAAEGDIIRGDGDNPLGGEGFITARGISRQIESVRNDSSIKAAIVRIDSPGGDGFASDEIWREVMLLHQKKPVVISMSDLAASGGYYMAMSGDPVLAYPGTITGSIGVFYGKADLHGLYSKIGVTKQLLSRGRFADIDSDYTPLSPAARQKLQSSIDQFYTTFVTRVANGRKRPYTSVEPLAQGRVWLGAAAKQNGLIDQLGGLDQAISVLKQRAGIPQAEDVRIVMFPPRRNLLDQLFAKQSTAFDLPGDLGAVLKRYSTRTWTSGGMLSLMPYTLEIR